MTDLKLSKVFYSDINNVSNVFNNSFDCIKSEIINSDYLKYHQKLKLLEGIIPKYEQREVLDLVTDNCLAITLSIATDNDNYFVQRFGKHITDESFLDFFQIFSKLINPEKVNQLQFSLENDENIKRLHEYVSTWKFEHLILLANNCGQKVLNYLCEKRPSLIPALDGKFKYLEKRNLYRYIICELKRSGTISSRINWDIRVIQRLALRYPEQCKLTFEKWTLSSKKDFFSYLIAENEIEFAKTIYQFLTLEQQKEVNKHCFAFYTDYDINSLDGYDLRNILIHCKNEVAFNKLLQLKNERFVDLILAGLTSIWDKEKIELLILSKFNLLELTTLLESNYVLAKRCTKYISSTSIIKHFTQYEWFWEAINDNSIINENVLQHIELGDLLANIHYIDVYSIKSIFKFYYHHNSSNAFKVFEALPTAHKLKVFLILKEYQNAIIEQYGMNFLIELAQTDMSCLRELIEVLPLNTAIFLINALKLEITDDCFKYMHRGRYKAISRRINIQLVGNNNENYS